VFIGKIIPDDPSRAFLGYVDKSASEKKIVRDVFKKGDSAFLSGIVIFWRKQKRANSIVFRLQIYQCIIKHSNAL
jgi:hypothetical protein